MRLNVLIFDRDPFVAQDMVETVLGVLPDANVHCVETVDDAEQLLASHAAWAWAILRCRPDDLSQDTFRSMLGMAGIVPVVVGDRFEAPDTKDWIFLNSPFSAPQLENALKQTLPVESKL